MRSILEVEESFEGKIAIHLNTPLPLAWHLLREIHCFPFFFQPLKRCLRCACFYELKTSHYIMISLSSTFSVTWFYVNKDNCGWSAIEKCYNSVLWKWKHLLAFMDFGVLWAVLGSWRALLGPPLSPHPLHARVYLGARWTSNSPAERVVLSSILWGDVHGDRMRTPGWWASRTVVLKGHGLTPDPQMPKWESSVEVYGVHQQLGNLRTAAILSSLAPASLPSQPVPTSVPQLSPFLVHFSGNLGASGGQLGNCLHLELSMVPFKFLCVWSVGMFFS